MLGWFKKKFGKKATEEKNTSPHPVESTLEESEIVEESVLDTLQPEAPETPEKISTDRDLELTSDSPSLLDDSQEHAEEATAQEHKSSELDDDSEIETLEPDDLVYEQESSEQILADSPNETKENEEKTAASEEKQEDHESEVTNPEEDPISQDESDILDTDNETSSSFFNRLQEKLGKTRRSFVHRLDALFLGKKNIDKELLDELEEILITADLGIATTMELLDDARLQVKRKELSDPLALKKVLQKKILAFLQKSEQDAELVMPEKGPFVIMVVGVNGVGKTTTIGKIAAKFTRSGHSVLLVAADTFRAAAIEQLKLWGDRVGADVLSQDLGTDPASVVYDGMEHGMARGYDVIIIDTAGRLHTKANLMEELKKIKRTASKKMPDTPHEIMLILDATTGQNAISQAKQFNESVTITGLALTKLDGTAKGGIVVNVCRELAIPVRFIGIGEQMDDLRDFDPHEFAEALFQTNDEN